MRHLLLICCLAVSAFLSSLDGEEIYPRLNLDSRPELPRNFRVSNAPYREGLHCEATREGLDKLRVSGSGQFSEESFKAILAKVDAKKLVIVDLRGEYHGLLNGKDVSWKGTGQSPYAYSAGLKADQLDALEEGFLLGLLSQQVAELKTDDGVFNVPVKSVTTEHDFVKRLGFEYYRIPIVHSKRPSDLEVDSFLAFFKITSFRSWIHVHCAGGKVRTTMIMSMLDIMSNSHLPLETILKRQEAIGGVNLYDPAAYSRGNPVKLEDGKERLAFLNQFHQYCLENPYFLETWSEWSSKKKPAKA